MGTFDSVIETFKQETDIKDDALQDLVVGAFMAGATALKYSQIVDAEAAATGTDVSGLNEGLGTIARLFGKTNATISDDQAATLKNAISQVVTLPENAKLLETALEGLFGEGYLQIVRSGKAFTAYADEHFVPAGE